MLPILLEQITLCDWMIVSKDIIKFHKSQLAEFNIDDSILKCVQHMNDSNINFLALMNTDRTQIQGYINFQEIIKYLVENYTGDLSFFEQPLRKFDLTNHNIFPSYCKLVIAKESESLYSVLKKMRDNRVSCIPIERSLSLTDHHLTRTIGLSFLTDLMFLFRLPQWEQYLEEPILTFVSDLNGLEEDAFEQ